MTLLSLPVRTRHARLGTVRRHRTPALGWGLALLAAGLELSCGASLPSMPVVQITPSSVQLQAGGGSQQFSATVINASNTSVVWKVNGALGGGAATGTISQTGLYQAPASLPSDAIEVEAVSAANANVEATAAVKLTAGVALNVSPDRATVAAGSSLQFTASVANAQDTTVNWSVNGTTGGNATVGTISTAGLYTAPASFPGLSQVSVTATSNADSAVSASAVVTLAQPVALTIDPATATINVGQTQAFNATVSGSDNQSVAWSINGVAGGNASLGTIAANGTFTAPASVPAPAAETLTATSQADPSKSATATLTIVAPVAIALNPLSATLKAQQSQQFTATVTNAQNTAVAWSVNGTAGGSDAVGTITASGLYTAPKTFPGLDQVTITAASVQDPTRTASATVKLAQPVSVAITPSSATVNLGATQPFAATVTGSSNPAVSWSVNGVAGGNATLGTIDNLGVYTAPANLPSPAQVTITATSQADSSQSASAQISLQTPPQAFTLSPASATLTLGKADSGSTTFQVAISGGFTQPIQLAVSGLPPNVTAALDHSSVTASGAVVLSLSTGSISLAATGIPITLTATATPASGAPLVQTATVLLTIGGWAGHVNTLAGGPGGVGYEDGSGATDALYPTALASDGGQNLYFADKRGTALRSYGLVSRTVATLVGGPYSYSIGEGDGVAFDPATQTVYVADGLRNRIVSYHLGDYDLKVVAGSDTAGYADGVGAAASFNYPHGLAISPDHATLYVADTNNEVIRAIDIASGAVTTLAGQHGVFRTVDGVGAAASFCQPTGLAIDAGGANLYVTDQCGYAVRQIALPGANVTTVAGSGAIGQQDGPAASATFYALRGVAVDPHPGAGLIYVCDRNKIRVIKLGANPTVYTLAGATGAGQADGAGGSASFYHPGGLAALADHVGPGTTTLFIADSDNGLLRRLDFTNPLTATGSGDAQATVTSLAGQPSHRGSSDGVGTGPQYTGASTATFSQPEGIVTDGKTAFVADSENGAIREIDLATTNVTTVAGPGIGYKDGPAASADFYKPAGVAWVPSQNLIYIADAGNGAIRKLDLTTHTVSTVAGTNASGYVDGPLAAARFNNPFGVLASPDGTKLYVADTGNNAIRLIDLTAGTVTTIAGGNGLGNSDGTGTAVRFAEPNGLAFDASGQNLYISDFENEAIREFNLATGQVTTLVGMAHQCGHADGPAASATLCNPAFISTDGRSLFWGDSNTGLLRVLNLKTGQVSTLAGSPGVMHAADGDYTETPGALTGPVRYNGVFGLAVAPDDSFILFTDKPENMVRIIH